MDPYSSVEARLSQLPVVSEWPELLAILRRAGARRPQAWELPLAACRAVGGTPEQALPGAAALAALQISIVLLDDELDDDPRGEHRHLGTPTVANMASAWQAASLEVLALADTSPARRMAAGRSLNRMALLTAWGQRLDARGVQDEAGYWRLVRAKSAPFFSAALEAGALLGGSTLALAGKLGQLGELYGVLIQIHDDMQDVMETPANPDWLKGRSPLPILYGQVVKHPEQKRFAALRAIAAQPRSEAAAVAEAVAEAQAILLRCGALSYAVHELLNRYRAAQAFLRSLNLPTAGELKRLLSAVVRPVQRLRSELKPAGSSAGR